MERIPRAVLMAGRLTVLRGVLEDDPGQAFIRLLRELSRPEPDAESVAAAYGRTFELLATEVAHQPGTAVGDAWQDHLLERLLSSENPFSRRAETLGFPEIGESLVAAVRHDLAILQLLFDLDAEMIGRVVDSVLGGTAPRWSDFGEASVVAPAVKAIFQRSADWGTLAEKLADHYYSSGAGDFGRFHAFRWVERQGETVLEGIENPDPITLDELIGYSLERELLIQNTEHFVSGYPANNVLLYGDRGTGKSSTVKALLNAFAGRKLRLVEVSKQYLGDFPRIVRMLQGRGERFILFVDDLSFEDNETHYKELKAVLEGGLEVRPHNVLLYATSNRRHLVRERFSDRSNGGSDELHVRDTMEEKLSLSDRFGITVTYSSPNQERYLEIVVGLAEQRGLDITKRELEDLALKWATRHNGRSGRTARQFVDHLTAALALNTARTSL